MRSLLPPGPVEMSYDDLASVYEFPAAPRGGHRWLRANFVSSVDGAAQGTDSRSGTLSSPADQQVFALQRSLCDVIVVGAGTARVEGYRPVLRSEVDVELRERLGLAPVPTIAVVSQSLTLDPALLVGGEAPTIVVTSAAAPTEALAAMTGQTRVIVAGEATVDIAAALAELALLGHERVLCEGGPTLLGQVVAADCLDDLCLTVAPLLLGGDRRRIQHGPDLLPPRRLTVAHLLDEDGVLFARYLVDRPA